MPDSPAESGFQPETQIIAIDGEDMTGIDGSTWRSGKSWDRRGRKSP
jgi:hypothetical protein